MDLSTLTKFSMVSIFQKTNYVCLVRVRKTSKRLDKFVEYNRFDVVSKSHDEVDFRITFFPKEMLSKKGKVYFSVTHQDVSSQLKDPYKQLSGISFREIRVIGHASLLFEGVEEYLEPEFVTLKKMKLDGNWLCIHDFTTDAVKKLLNTIRYFNLWVYLTRKGFENLDYSEIFEENTISQRIDPRKIEGRWSDFEHSPSSAYQKLTEPLLCFICSHSSYIYASNPLVIVNFIKDLCEINYSLEDRNIRFSSHYDFLNEAICLLPETHTLLNLTSNDHFPDNHKTVRVTNGVHKWLLLFERRLKDKTHVTVIIIHKDLRQLLAVIARYISKYLALFDPSTIVKDFINTSDMDERHEILQSYYMKCCQ